MLHELIEYGKRHGIEGEAGFTPKTVRWLINFDTSGRYIGTMPAAEGGKTPTRTLPKVPHLKFSGDTPMRQFLVDTAQYALLFGQDVPDEKLIRKHQFFLNLLREAGDADPAFTVIAEAIENSETRQAICNDLAQQTAPKVKPSDNLTFAVLDERGGCILAEQDHWHDWWRGYFPSLFKKDADKQQAAKMRCFLSGHLDDPTLTHPKIKGLGDVGGNVETTLVGFNKRAFRSYGLEQSANAAVSADAAQTYVAVLNDLIARRSRRLAGAKIVYWYVGDVREEEGEDVLGAMLTPDLLGVSVNEEEDKANINDGDDPAATRRRENQAVARVEALLDAIRSGHKAERLRNARFCAMTLSGNAGRVVIRDWMEGAFENLLESVRAWFADLSIINRDGQYTVDAHKFGAVLAAPVRDLSDVPAPLVAALWRCAVHNRPIPYEMMAQTLMRVRLDAINGESARHARIGLLKAFCIRNLEMSHMTTNLNDDLNDPAYLCGRIMSLLADIQRAALGDVGAGVVQRYYAAASATPGLILGRLVRLAQTGHLPKIDGGLRHWFEQQLGDVWARLEQRPPSVLRLEEQTLFAMGYYHQKVRRPEKSEAEAAASSETSE